MPSAEVADVRLSIVMPVYNEENTIASAIGRVLAVSYPCGVEVIVVNDGSRDRTAELLGEVDDPRVRVQTHQRNQGKGAAVLTGIAAAAGTHVLIFDADLEYDPEDVPNLLAPVLNRRAHVVYGSRIQGVHTAYHSLHYAVGNRATTWAANLLFNAYLKDLHTCLKLIPVSLLRQLELTERGFGLDTEITAKILHLGIRPFEVPVSYYSRSRDEGKKITWQDGLACVNILVRVRSRRRPNAQPLSAPALPAQRRPEAVHLDDGVGPARLDESVA